MFAICRKCCHFAIISTSLLLSTPTLADTLIVRVDGLNGSATPGGLGNGWGSNAYLFLQDGLDRAAALLVIDPTDLIEVWVRGATDSGISYYPDDGATVDENESDESFRMRPNVFIYGGFHNTHTLLSQRNPATYLTILSGEINTAGFSDNSYHVVTADNTNITLSNCILDGFTITKGNGSGDGQGGFFGGGGVFIDDGTDIRIHRCLITDNRAGFSGAEDEEGSGITHDGAGAQINASAPVFTLCTFSNNQNNSGAVIYGGGAAVQNDADPDFINCRFSGNQSGHGGGLAITGGAHADIVNCLFIDNNLQTGGSNTVWGGGVAVAFTGSSADLVNCTFSDNTAVKGGGYAQYRTEEVSSIRNAILWLDDGTSSGDEILIEGTTTTNRLVIRHSDIRDRSGGGVDAPTGTIDYGTPDTNIGENTTTHDPNFDGTYHLQCRSPCMNMGLNTVVPADTYDLDNDTSGTEATPDLDLLERIAGNPVIVDMGAFEKPYTAPTCPGEVIGGTPVDIDDLLAVISAWGSCTVCTYDISPQPCGDGTIDINDLLVVIGNWCCPLPAPCPMSLNDVEDCMDAASLEYQPYSPEWIDVVEKCAEAFED